jgi:hypothetical protein
MNDSVWCLLFLELVMALRLWIRDSVVMIFGSSFLRDWWFGDDDYVIPVMNWWCCDVFVVVCDEFVVVCGGLRVGYGGSELVRVWRSFKPSPLFLSFFCFDSVLVEREIVIVFLVSWHEMNGSLWFWLMRWPFIGCHLWMLDQWNSDTWTGLVTDWTNEKLTRGLD